MIKAVVFDLDNTLLDFMKMKDTAVRAAVSSMVFNGLDINKDDAISKIYKIYDNKGYEYQEVFDVFLKEVIGKVDYKILASGIIAYKRAKENSLMLYKNVNATLHALSKIGLKLAVVSDAPSREAWMRLYYLNLHHVFDPVLTFDDTGARKPSPEPFKLALEKMSVEPSEALMIGDWPDRDVVGAKQIGMKTIFARYGDTFGTKESGADWDVNDIYEIVEIIKGLNNV